MKKQKKNHKAKFKKVGRYLFITISFYAVLFGIMFLLIGVKISETAQHNIDLTYNMLNIQCDYCITEMYESGIDGVTRPLSEYYRNSMRLLNVLEYFLGLSGFLLGFFMYPLIGLAYKGGGFK